MASMKGIQAEVKAGVSISSRYLKAGVSHG